MADIIRILRSDENWELTQLDGFEWCQRNYYQNLRGPSLAMDFTVPKEANLGTCLSMPSWVICVISNASNVTKIMLNWCSVISTDWGPEVLICSSYGYVPNRRLSISIAYLLSVGPMHTYFEYNWSGNRSLSFMKMLWDVIWKMSANLFPPHCIKYPFSLAQCFLITIYISVGLIYSA